MADIDMVEETDAAAPADPWRPPGTTVVAILALAWFVIELGINYRTVDPQTGEVATAQEALTLPTTVAATLIAGAAIGLICVRRLSGRFGDVERWRSRSFAGAVGGLPVGIVAAVGAVSSYHAGSLAVWVAVTLGLVGVIGGALAGIRPTATVTAGLAGTLAYVAIVFVEALFRNNLRSLLGNQSTNGGYADAEARLVLIVAVVSAIVAGVTAFAFLRRTGLALPWPVYLGAGATPGLVLLFAEAATWLGGRAMLNQLGRASEFDKITVSLATSSLVDNGMIVLFGGAITAMILVGRTLRAR